jgi:hypothetical protein
MLEVTNKGNIDDRNVITYDEGQPHNGDGSRRWKRCEHSWYCGVEGVVTFRHVFQANPRLQWQGQYEYYYPDSYQLLLPNLRRWQSLSIPSTQALLAGVANEMAGRLEASELPITDVFQLYTSVKKSGNPAKELVQPFYDLFRRKPKNIRDLIKKASGADLAWKFGIVPLVKTLLGVLNAAERVDNHMRKLDRRQASAQLNFSVTDHPYDVVHAAGTSYYTDVQANKRVRASYRHRTRMSTKVFFRTTVDYDTSDNIRTKLLWDAYGISNIFSTVWDILPWSFVVDWFTNLGAVVGEMDKYLFHTSPLERLGRLTDVWATVTRRTWYEFYDFVPMRTSSDSWTEGLTASLQVMSSGNFVRQPLDPGEVGNFLQTLNVGGSPLTTAQTVTGLELLVQRTL